VVVAFGAIAFYSMREVYGSAGAFVYSVGRFAETGGRDARKEALAITSDKANQEYEIAEMRRRYTPREREPIQQNR